MNEYHELGKHHGDMVADAITDLLCKKMHHMTKDQRRAYLIAFYGKINDTFEKVFEVLEGIC